MTATDVIELYEALERKSIEIWIDGGWGVDAPLGKQTRPHRDLDIAVQRPTFHALARPLVMSEESRLGREAIETASLAKLLLEQVLANEPVPKEV